MGARLRRHLMRLNCWLYLVAVSLTAASVTAGCARKERSSAVPQMQKQMRDKTPVTVELIPRKLIFGNPDRAGVQISPDGKYVSFLAPRDGVMNVYVAPADDPSQAKPITNDRTRGIPNCFWAYDSKHVL